MEMFSCSFRQLLDMGFRNHIDAHYRELNDGAFELAPDFGRYLKMDELGLLKCYAATVDGALAGYAIFIVSPHLHYSTSVWAHEDLYYLAPEYRKGLTGYKWMKFFLQDIEKCADKVIVGTKLKLETGAILKRLGYTHFENLYSKKCP